VSNAHECLIVHEAIVGLSGDEGFRAICSCGWKSHASWDRAVVVRARDDHKRRSHLRSVP